MITALTTAVSTWSIARATGVVALVMLTVTTALGIAVHTRTPLVARSRLATTLVHRGSALIGLGLVGVHLVSLLLDTYVNISPIDALVPFVSEYRPLWTGLGTVAVDLLLLIVVTSLLRHRLSPRVWRTVHLASYALWPIALAHGFGAGTDAGSTWFVLVAAACAACVAGAVAWRLLTPPARDARGLFAPAPAAPAAHPVLLRSHR